MRNIGTSVRALELGIAMLSAVALAFAFPKAGQAWLAPLGAAGLFWTWQRLSWKRAFFTGWFAGTIFFAIGFSWFTYTVGDYVGRFAFAVVLIPALLEGLAFALSAVATVFAIRHAPAWLAPVGAAAAFTVFEWLRSIGALAVPFAQIGYSQTGTPLAVFAAYVGSYGVTFIVMLIGAYIAHALASRAAMPLAILVATIAAAWCACYAAWPARHSPRPALRIAAVQGNIAQSIKWDPATVRMGITRYLTLARRLAPLDPQLTVLPETVIAEELNRDPQTFTRVTQLARALNTTLVVGSLEATDDGEYNALYTFAPSGALVNVYRKRQLVPFTETLPGRSWLGWIPDANLIGRFAHGTDDTVLYVDGTPFAPLICWESAFADLVHAQIARGAKFLVVATDDAWFGETSGTYQHAQIAQMRAIESGEWVLQSASTGISGIISPAGRWTEATQLDTEALVAGSIGAPPGSFFARIGPAPVGIGLIALYCFVIAAGALRRRYA